MKEKSVISSSGFINQKTSGRLEHQSFGSVRKEETQKRTLSEKHEKMKITEDETNRGIGTSEVRYSGIYTTYQAYSLFALTLRDFQRSESEALYTERASKNQLKGKILNVRSHFVSEYEDSSGIHLEF